MSYKHATAEKLEQLAQLQLHLKTVKSEEEKLRREICDELLDGRGVGTHNLEIDGYKVKVVKKLNYSIDEDLLEATYDDMEPEEQACIKFKPQLKLTDYNRLESSPLLDDVIESKPAMPSIEIKHLGE